MVAWGWSEFFFFLQILEFIHRLFVHPIGKWKADAKIPQDTSLEKSEERLVEGENKVMFMKFMRSMLQWRPEDRKTARVLFDDPWLNGKV